MCPHPHPTGTGLAALSSSDLAAARPSPPAPPSWEAGLLLHASQLGLCMQHCPIACPQAGGRRLPTHGSEGWGPGAAAWAAASQSVHPSGCSPNTRKEAEFTRRTSSSRAACLPACSCPPPPSPSPPLSPPQSSSSCQWPRLEVQVPGLARCPSPLCLSGERGSQSTSGILHSLLVATLPASLPGIGGQSRSLGLSFPPLPLSDYNAGSVCAKSPAAR